MKKLIKGVVALAVFGSLAVAPSASAHVTLQPSEAPAGEFTRLDVRVPNERDNASTAKVDVQLPDGFLFVSTEPVPGWEAKVRREKLATPTKVFGEKISEQVKRVTFTAQDDGAKIGPGQFIDFGLSLLVPKKPNTTLTFKALQTYDSGEVVRWIAPPDAEEPAPEVKIVAAAAEGAGEDTGTAARASGEDDDASKGLGIAALVLGILGVVLGGAALATRRRAA